MSTALFLARARVPVVVAEKGQIGAVLTNCAVRGIEQTGGCGSAVATERGRIGCEIVVLAGDSWSHLFCGNLGLDLPQLKVLGSVSRTKPMDGLPDVIWIFNGLVRSRNGTIDPAQAQPDLAES